MAQAPSVLNIHTPTSSFAIVHSLTQETLLDLYNKVSRKHNTDYYGERVGPGWLKYEYNDAVWNLDDDSDYTIFVWRQQQSQQQQPEEQPWQSAASESGHASVASTSRPYTPSIYPAPSMMPATPTLHLHNPKKPLPEPPAYLNRAYYMFQPSRAGHYPPLKKSPAPSHASTTRRSRKSKSALDDDDSDGVPKFKKQFDRFHSENGVRTVMGSIGPVHDVRMLLKTGYRHVYISRKFAIKHGFIPPDAAPGNYGYGGLVNIGKWPITLTPSSTQPNMPAAGYQRPDAFLTPISTPSHTPISSPRIPDSSLPSQGLLAPPNSNGKTRNIRSSTKKSHHMNGGHSDAHNTNPNGPKPVMIEVYLSEEPHFDVVLGRSFIEKRNIKMNGIDPTDVVCLDTGEKIDCELVILKDGRGEIVTVT